MSNLKTEFANIQMLMFFLFFIFKHEESDKVSVDSTHTQGACGGESIELPIVSASHSSTIDAEYVSVSSNTITIFLRLL